MREALQRRPPGRFALMAAIAAVHAEAPTWSATDWSELVGLYDLLVVIWPSPVVALNRAVAVGFAEGPDAGLKVLDGLAGEPQLAVLRLPAVGPRRPPPAPRAAPPRPAPPTARRST